MRFPPNIHPFLANEAALRALHGEGALYVKPMIYAKQADLIVVGGWAFLDGEPAILPDGLTLLTITYETPANPLHTVGRDPKAVLALLGDRVARHEAPCPHYTVTVREADKASLLAKIEALPEHEGTLDRPSRAGGDGIGGWILVGLLALIIGAVIVTAFMR